MLDSLRDAIASVKVEALTTDQAKLMQKLVKSFPPEQLPAFAAALASELVTVAGTEETQRRVISTFNRSFKDMQNAMRSVARKAGLGTTVRA